MEEIFLDVETKKAFVETGKYDPVKLGVSFVGICRRNIDGEKEDEFVGFFENQLKELWSILEQAKRIVGFNLVGFDLPVLSAYYYKDFSDFPVLDILDEVKIKLGHRVSLDALAKETLGKQKLGTGLDALEFYEKGRLKELAEYCLMDVKITRDLYDYGKKYKHLKFKDKWNRLVEVPVNFSDKRDGEGIKVQMSLGV